MRKHIFLLTVVSAVIFGVVLMTSCNTATSPEAGTGTDTMAKAENDTAKKLSKIEGFLNILWTDTATFIQLNDTLKGKLTLRFYIKDANSLTLHGWSNDTLSKDFPTPPNLELAVGGTTAFEFGPGTYLGNIVLYNKSMRIIVRKIKNREAKYVLFVPKDPGTEGGQISYEIYITKIDPRTIKISDIMSDKETFATTGEHTNPSPPRGSY